MGLQSKIDRTAVMQRLHKSNAGLKQFGELYSTNFETMSSLEFWQWFTMIRHVRSQNNGGFFLEIFLTSDSSSC